MAVLDRNGFMAHIQTLTGEKMDDDTLKIMEDMTDTFDSLSGGDSENWKQKYQDLDNEWKRKYKERFFSGPAQPTLEQSAPREDPEPEDDWQTNPKTEYDMFYRTA